MTTISARIIEYFSNFVYIAGYIFFLQKKAPDQSTIEPMLKGVYFDLFDVTNHFFIRMPSGVR